MPTDISTLEEQEEDQVTLPEEDFSKAFDEDFEVTENAGTVDKEDESDEEDASEAEEQSEEKEDEEESLLDKLEKVAKEKFADDEEVKEIKEVDKKEPGKDGVTEPTIEVDFSDIDKDPQGFVTSLVDSISDTGVRDRISDLVSTNPEIGELAAIVARAVVDRQKIKVVKDENSFDFSKEDLESLSGKLEALTKAEEARKFKDEERVYWEGLEELHPGARAKEKDKDFKAWVDKQSDLIKKMTMTWNPEDYQQVFEAYDQHVVREKARTEVDKQTKDKKLRDKALTSVEGTSSKPGAKSAQNLGFEEAFERFTDG